MVVGQCILLLAVAVVSVWLWWLSRNHYWKRRGVPYLTPVWPVFGNILHILLFRSLPTIIDKMYKDTAGLPYVGLYFMHKPVLFVRDVELAGRMLTSDFSYFVNRGFHSNADDPLVKNLIHQIDSEWRLFRAKITSSLSSKRVKACFPVIKEKSAIFLSAIESEQLKRGYIDGWRWSIRFTTDVLIESLFGVDVECLKIAKSPYLVIVERLQGFILSLHFFTGLFMPSVHRLFGFSPSNKKTNRLFDSLTRQLFENRTDCEGKKDDLFLNVLQTSQEMGSGDTHSDVVGQVYGLYLAGVESTGVIITCMLYELAKNQDIQHSLHLEITEVLSAFDNQVTYDSVQQMKYLQQIVSECLRLYPPLTLLFRCCSKDYIIPGSTTVLEKGTLVFVPLKNIHEDPDHYPDPMTFDPGRFSGDCRHRGAQYVPFGLGPRICPGSLLSCLEIKTVIVDVIRRFEVHVTSKTPHHFQADPLSFLLAPNGEVQIAFKNRHI